MSIKHYTVKWLALALQDMQEIAAYIAENSPTKAQEVAQEIWNCGQSLKALPARGKPGRVPGTRELALVGLPFFLAFRVVGDTVQILRVMHTARQWPPVE